MYTNVCKFCGKIFIGNVKSSACQDCKNADDDLFTKIENYLKQYPNSNAIQIAEGLEISALDVLRYIDEGRLQVAKGEFKKI